MKQIRKRLTYANVMSSIAVFLVLGGATALAASKITAKQLQANSVTTAKIKKSAVTASKIKDSSITTPKIADDAVTGDKVKESTLGQVPSAASAINATNAVNATNATNAVNAGKVNGQSVVRIFDTIPNGTTNHTIAVIDGFTLSADCTGSNVENLILDPPNNSSDLKAQGNGNAGPIFESNQGAEPNEISLDDDGTNDNERGETSFSAATSTGTVISGEIGFNDPGSFNVQNVCSFYGQVLVTG